jgi:hypothetical protein
MRWPAVHNNVPLNYFILNKIFYLIPNCKPRRISAANSESLEWHQKYDTCFGSFSFPLFTRDCVPASRRWFWRLCIELKWKTVLETSTRHITACSQLPRPGQNLLLVAFIVRGLTVLAFTVTGTRVTSVRQQYACAVLFRLHSGEVWDGSQAYSNSGPSVLTDARSSLYVTASSRILLQLTVA